MKRKKVFISSTCFDLVDLRSEIANVLKEWGFYPVWNESPDFPIRKSLHSHDLCLEAVKESDIYILIIDKRYGSTYAGNNNKYKIEGISVTWLEARVAFEQGKEMYCFVRDVVYNERSTYKKNKKIKPHNVDNPKVFEFIDYIVYLPKNNWIHTFKDSIDLKNKLGIILINNDIPFRVYYHRDDSDSDMVSDIQRFQCLSFLGISHRYLETYINKLLNADRVSLPTKLINIYFASSEDGEIWEGNQYLFNIKEIRQAIASLLTNPAWIKRLLNLNSINFLQCTNHATFGGCMMKNNKGVNSLIYVVNYLPTTQKDTQKLLTFRIYNPGFNVEIKKIKQAYHDAYNVISKKVKEIGNIKPSLWDLSVQEWRSFSRNCQAHRSSMNYLIGFAQLTGAERVIDLASGTGDVSEILLTVIPDGELTLLDASPQMLEASKKLLGRKAIYALCRVPVLHNGKSIDLDGPYDIIVCHLALPSIAATTQELKRTVLWCRTQLKSNGRVILCAHNTAVNISTSSFNIKRDILRNTLKQIASKMGLEYRVPLNNKFTQKQIERSFTDVGFKCNRREVRNFPMTMNDRMVMWSTPAVLNELLDVRKLSEAQLHELIQSTQNIVRDLSTPDMAVMYWSFTAT